MKHRIKVVVLVFSLLFFTCPVFADHSHEALLAEQAYEAGDYTTAYKLWSVAAEKGEPLAQEMLGAMSFAGQGVPQSYSEAVKWYRQAAEQGKISAQYRLGKLYFDGLGVEQSLERAYAWWLVAAASGNDTARDLRTSLSEKMTPEQLERANAVVIEILLKLAE